MRTPFHHPQLELNFGLSACDRETEKEISTFVGFLIVRRFFPSFSLYAMWNGFEYNTVALETKRKRNKKTSAFTLLMIRWIEHMQLYFYRTQNTHTHTCYLTFGTTLLHRQNYDIGFLFNSSCFMRKELTEAEKNNVYWSKPIAQ